MPIQILMPALSPTMTEGKIARWLKAEGDPVSPGDALAEIETDKATMELEAADEGILGRILVPAGSEGVAVNTPIALLLAEGETAEAVAPAPSPSPPPPPTPPAPAAAPAPTPAPAPPPVPSAPVAETRIAASPLARRMAREARLDLSRIRGTGPHGRIVKADIDQAVGTAVPPVPPAPPVAPPPEPSTPAAFPFGPAFVEVPHSTIRRTIARRMTESVRTAPHFHLTIDVDLMALLALREQFNQPAPAEQRLSLTDFAIKAVAVALRRVPAANVAWRDDAMLQFTEVDVAVAVDTPSGLVTPVIRRADALGLREISTGLKDLAARAREGRLRPEDYTGGGFTLSNLGMLGVRAFAGVINPPQACLLGLGAAEQRPVVKNGALGIATVMTCTLAADHRAIDGAVGARFLAAFKGMIEQPTTMLL
ncbi:MAG: pyruvate dehydrogenase complex dihydrolipoamide acetyltransferase [Alphaproteobacteria bacterium]